MLAARFHGHRNRYGTAEEVGADYYACSPLCGIENRQATSNPNSRERRVVMNLGNLFGGLGGIGDLFAPFIGVIEAILSLLSGLFDGLGGLGG